MNDEWHKFVEQQAATLGTAGAGAAPNCLLTDLGRYGLIHFQGRDVDTFLQGQLTNDIGALRGTISQLSAWCNVKGRVEVLFRLFRWGDGVLAQCPRAQVEFVITRMRMFVMRADVKIVDMSSEWACFGVSGSAAAARLQVEVTDPPSASDGVVPLADGLLVRMPGDAPAFQCLAPPGDAQALWQNLAADAELDQGEYWTVSQIRAGMPYIDIETQGEFLPQMLNLDQLGGVSFDKGCYIGQEVVARTQHLGRLKRRMFGIVVRTDGRPNPGESIYLSGDDKTQSVGKIVVAGSTQRGQYDALAVLQLEAAGSGALGLGNLLGSELSVRGLHGSESQPA